MDLCGNYVIHEDIVHLISRTVTALGKRGSHKRCRGVPISAASSLPFPDPPSQHNTAIIRETFHHHEYPAALQRTRRNRL